MSAPIPEGFTVEPADYRRDFDSLRAIRDEVFVRGQNVPAEIELDALDPLCQHVIARSAEGEAIGTGRLMPDGRIGRMAVIEAWRERGVGGVMLERLVEIARGVAPVAQFTSRSGEIVLVPPAILGPRWQRFAVGRQVDDDVAADFLDAAFFDCFSEVFVFFGVQSTIF